MTVEGPFLRQSSGDDKIRALNNKRICLWHWTNCLKSTTALGWAPMNRKQLYLSLTSGEVTWCKSVAGNYASSILRLISRRIKQRSQEQADENSWNYYKQKIQEWITLIELHEASLTGEKLTHFVGKHKWWLGGTCAVIASITSTVIASWILSLWTWANWRDRSCVTSKLIKSCYPQRTGRSSGGFNNMVLLQHLKNKDCGRMIYW